MMVTAFGNVANEDKPSCLMGHKQFSWRRKQDAECYVGEKYKDPEPVEENCPCTDEDYECDYNYRREDGKCELIGQERIISGKCENPGDKYLTSSGYRKIPGNTCINPESNRKDAPVEKECGQEGAEKPKPSVPVGQITHTENAFEGLQVQYMYLERSETSSGDDETILMHVGQRSLYLSSDGGGSWRRILEEENVVSIHPNPYFHDWMFFVTADQTVYYTRNRGKDILPFEGPSGLPISNIEAVTKFSFHPKHAGWFIWVGDQGCNGGDCHTYAQYTKNAGETWHDLTKYVRECSWIQGVKNSADETLIYCLQYSSQSGNQRDKLGETTQLVSSFDFFDNMEVKLDRVIGMANLDEYVIAAFVDEDNTNLRMAVTVDGAHFADANFPPRFSTSRQTAYTVLDSVTKSVFLHITTNDERNREFGTIMKSNSNGTYYVTSLDNVNRDVMGYVDFEKVQGLEGVALVNVVANSAEVAKGDESKKLKTKITHSDGGEWFYLTPPEKDSDGKSYSCDTNKLDKCSLNLHGYTERKDVRDTFSSGSAVGVLLAVGNVDEYLASYSEGNTFISDDAGVTWREVHKGPYTWEFGDQGGIIVVVKDNDVTDQVLYSVDQGRTWTEYKFSEKKVNVIDLATVPSDTSRKFMIVAIDPDSREETLAIQLDFTNLHDRKCKFHLVTELT